MSTGTVELTAKKLMVALAISAELEEDSVLPIVPVIRDDLAKAFALAEENVFINGDTAHTATQTEAACATEANWYVLQCQCKISRIAGKSLEPNYYNVISTKRNKRECLKNVWIRQSAAEPEREGSETMHDTYCYAFSNMKI